MVKLWRIGAAALRPCTTSPFYDSLAELLLRFEPGEDPLGVLVENLFFLFGR
jgi:hypothetical protein